MFSVWLYGVYVPCLRKVTQSEVRKTKSWCTLIEDPITLSEIVVVVVVVYEGRPLRREE